MDLVLRVTGEVLESNFQEYKEMILASLDQVNLNPETDEEFAEAEEKIKKMAQVEKAIEEAKKKALAETADIRELFEAMTEISGKLREVRLELGRKVKQAKERKKDEVVQRALSRLHERTSAVLREHRFIPPGTMTFDRKVLEQAGKGKRKLETFTIAVEKKLNELLETVELTTQVCVENHEIITQTGQPSLFPDVSALVIKPQEELKAIVASRLAKYEAEQAKKKLERERAESKRKAHEEAAEIEQTEKKDAPDDIHRQSSHPARHEPDPKNAPENSADAEPKEEDAFLLTVALYGTAEAVTRIAKDVDAIVSRHDEVRAISLTRDRA